jgi:hypothetical protein
VLVAVGAAEVPAGCEAATEVGADVGVEVGDEPDPADI